jgi:sulfide:quinone oxidoreductase
MATASSRASRSCGNIVGLRPLEQGSRPLARLRERGIEFVQAEITGIDPDRRSVETTGGVLEGDYLVVALGAAFDPAQVRQLGGSAHSPTGCAGAARATASR